MPFELWCYHDKPLCHENIATKVAIYSTRNEARWWAVNLLKRGSINLDQGGEEETLIPRNRVYYMKIKEV